MVTVAVGGRTTAFAGLLINMVPEEKQSLPRIGDKSLAIDEKCAGYMAGHPELVPSFLNMAEMDSDRKVVAALLPTLRELAPIVEGLEDTIMLANSDNMVADLAFYQNVKHAAKRAVAGSGTIYDDLKTRFPGRSRKDDSIPQPTV